MLPATDQYIDQLRDIDPGRILFIMACSAKKVATSYPLPLRDLYDGPTWRTLRTHGAFLDSAQILVLSGKYGWVSAGEPSADYNERLTPEKASALVQLGARKPYPLGSAPEHLAQIPGGGPWQAVVICAGEEYRRVIDVVVRELKAMAMIDRHAPVIATSGGIGYQRGQLGEILRALAPDLRPSAVPGM